MSRPRITRKHKEVFTPIQTPEPITQEVPQAVVDSSMELLLLRAQKISQAEADPLTVESLFIECIKDHLKIISYKPHSYSSVGMELLHDGRFHECWARVLMRNQFLKLQKLWPSYYAEYKPIILKNQAIFERSFSSFSKDLFFQPPQPETQQKQPEKLINESQITENISAEDESEERTEGGDELQNQHENHNPSIRYVRLLMDGHRNRERIQAEKVCMFLNIPNENIFSFQQVIILEVLENYSQNKFIYSVVRAYVKQDLVKTQKIFITCYKLFCLEQLIRIQHMYGKIYGFLTHLPEVNAYKELKEMALEIDSE